jgi:DinB superfamily
MELASIVRSQCYAALAMLQETVQRCPPSLWDDPQDRNAFWRVAFHTLFYTHLYIQQEEPDYRPWAKHRGEAQYFGPIFFEGNREPVLAEPYTQAEILEYLDFCRDQITELTPLLDYAGPSGFEWIPLSKLELQFYNIRHIQHHTGELFERLGTRAKVDDLRWVGADQ